MAIQFVGGRTAAKAGATSGTSTIALNSGLTGGIASSVAEGDLVIAVFARTGTSNSTLSITDGANDYTLIDSQLYANDTYDTVLRVAYKFMGSTPDTNTTFGPTNSTASAGTMAVYCFRGVDQTTPLDVTVTTATGTNSGLPNPPSITPSTSGAFIVAIGASGHSSAVDTFTSSDLTDFRTVGWDDSADSTLGIGHKDDWTSGAFDPAQFGATYGDSTSYSWVAMSIALRPAVTVVDLTATGITVSPVVGTPAIGQIHALTATGIATSAPSVGAPALTQEHSLDATGIATGSPSVGAPALGQEHALSAGGIDTGSPTVGSPAITQEHAFTATGITVSPTVGTPALGQEHALSADGIATGSPSVGTPALGQEHVLSAGGIDTGSPTVGTPALGTDGTDALSADGISTGAPTVGTPVIGIVSEIVVQPATGGWEWLNNLNPPSRRAPEPEPPKRRKKRRVIRDERIDLEPDPIIERGIVQTVPAWDAMARLQQMQAEAEIARAQRLRAIALADDDWLMMA